MFLQCCKLCYQRLTLKIASALGFCPTFPVTLPAPKITLFLPQPVGERGPPVTRNTTDASSARGSGSATSKARNVEHREHHGKIPCEQNRLHLQKEGHFNHYLVGGFNPSENTRQIGNLPQARGKMKKYLKPPPSYFSVTC